MLSELTHLSSACRRTVSADAAVGKRNRATWERLCGGGMDSRTRLLRYLQDAWALETAMVGMLKTMADDVADPAVRALFLEHRDITRAQAARLKARMAALDARPSRLKSAATRLAGSTEQLLHAGQDVAEKRVQHLLKAYSAEQFERAMYHALEAFATALGDPETALLARRHGEEEKAAADRIWPHLAPAASLLRDPLTLAGSL